MKTALHFSLEEELERANYQVNIASEELEKLPKGYISKKIINKKPQYYIQWIENGSIKSKYVKKADFENALSVYNRKKELKKLLKTAKYNKEMLERALNVKE